MITAKLRGGGLYHFSVDHDEVTDAVLEYQEEGRYFSCVGTQECAATVVDWDDANDEVTVEVLPGIIPDAKVGVYAVGSELANVKCVLADESMKLEYGGKSVDLSAQGLWRRGR